MPFYIVVSVSIAEIRGFVLPITTRMPGLNTGRRGGLTDVFFTGEARICGEIRRNSTTNQFHYIPGMPMIPGISNTLNEKIPPGSAADNQAQCPIYADLTGDIPSVVIVGNLPALRQAAAAQRLTVAPVCEHGSAALCMVSRDEKTASELVIEYALKRAGFTVQRHPSGYRLIVREGAQ